VPASASAHNNLGAALQLSGDLEGAASAFRRSLAIEPSRGAYSNLGTVHYFLKDYEQAASNYQRATALADQDQTLWGNLGDALWQISGRREEAVGHYRRASVLARRELESNPEDGILLAQLGYYQGRIGDADASQAYLRQAASTPESPYRLYYAAVAAADRGDPVEARRAALEALRLGYPESLLRADPSLTGIDLARPTG
jgi:tetratricopeptide (TPR) repeat protein